MQHVQRGRAVAHDERDELFRVVDRHS
jgi:hypothetical protein